MLVAERISKNFGTTAAVADASFQIDRGSFTGVIGRSGAGKSTLLRVINRLIDPSEGRILYEGTDITALRGAALRQWRARAAMIFQQFNLVGRLDVLTNVLMGRLGAVQNSPPPSRPKNGADLPSAALLPRATRIAVCGDAEFAEERKAGQP
jgi:phosphonate transport system ATP-binding protein